MTYPSVRGKSSNPGSTATSNDYDVTVTYPATINANDIAICVAIHGINNTSYSVASDIDITGDSGWTELVNTTVNNASGTVARVVIWWRRCGGSEDGTSQTVTQTGGQTGSQSVLYAHMFALYDCYTSGNWYDDFEVNTGYDTTLSVAGPYVGASDSTRSLMMFLVQNNNPSVPTAPTNWTYSVGDNTSTGTDAQIGLYRRYGVTATDAPSFSGGDTAGWLLLNVSATNTAPVPPPTPVGVTLAPSYNIRQVEKRELSPDYDIESSSQAVAQTLSPVYDIRTSVGVSLSLDGGGAAEISFIAGAQGGGSGSSSLSVDVSGLSLQAGDLVVVVINNLMASSTETMTPTGTYQCTNSRNASPTNRADGGFEVDSTTGGFWVFHRIVTTPASETAYTFTSSAAVSYSIIAMQFRGVHADVWDVKPDTGGYATSAPTGTTATAPSITIGNAGATALLMGGVGTGSYGNGTSGIDGTSIDINGDSVTNSYSDDLCYYMVSTGGYREQATFYQHDLSTGAMGTSSFTLRTADEWVVVQASLKPAAGGSGGYDIQQAVGVTLSPVYDVQTSGSTVQRTLEPVYSLRQVQKRELSPLYQLLTKTGERTLSPVYQIAQVTGEVLLSPVYSLRQLAQRTLAAAYDVRQLAAKTLAPAYDVRVLAKQVLSPVYQLLSKTGAALLSPVYQIRQLAEQLLNPVYDIRQLAQRTFATLYDILAQTGQVLRTLSPSYDVRQAVPKVLIPNYLVGFTITAEEPSGDDNWVVEGTGQLEWSVSIAVAEGQFASWLIDQAHTEDWYSVGYWAAEGTTDYSKQISLAGIPAGTFKAIIYYRRDTNDWTWEVPDQSGDAVIAFVQALAQLLPVYQLRQLAETTFSPVYAIRQLAQQLLSPVYSLRQLATQTLSPLYDILALGLQLVMQTLSPSYDLRQLAESSLSPLYSLRSLALASLAPVYALRALALASLAPVYAIRALVLAVLSPVYSLRSLVAAALSPVYGILAATGALTLEAVYDIRQAIEKQLSPLYDIIDSSLEAVQRTLAAVYSIRQLGRRELSPVYSIRQRAKRLLASFYTIFGDLPEVYGQTTRRRPPLYFRRLGSRRDER